MSKHEKVIEELKKQLKELTLFLLGFEVVIDNKFKGTDDKDLAELLNKHSVKVQSAMHFGLGYSFKKIENIYNKYENQLKGIEK